MAVRLAPDVGDGDPQPDPEARFELLGVLICAHCFVSDEAAMDILAHYLEDARTTMTNTVTLRRPEGDVIAVADIRAGCATSSPRVTIRGAQIGDTLAAALVGRPLSDLVAVSWLRHPGLTIREVEVERGERPLTRIRLEPTRLDVPEAVEAIVSTAHHRRREAA